MHTRRLPQRADALAPGQTSAAVRHRTVTEVCYVLGGRGELWRSLDGEQEVVALAEGVCADIPLGAAFPFRALGPQPLRVLLGPHRRGPARARRSWCGRWT